MPIVRARSVAEKLIAREKDAAGAALLDLSAALDDTASKRYDVFHDEKSDARLKRKVDRSNKDAQNALRHGPPVELDRSSLCRSCSPSLMITHCLTLTPYPDHDPMQGGTSWCVRASSYSSAASRWTAGSTMPYPEWCSGGALDC